MTLASAVPRRRKLSARSSRESLRLTRPLSLGHELRFRGPTIEATVIESPGSMTRSPVPIGSKLPLCRKYSTSDALPCPRSRKALPRLGRRFTLDVAFEPMQIVHQAGHSFVAYPVFPGYHSLDTCRNQLQGRILQQDAPRSQLQRFDDLFFLDRRGQNDGSHLLRARCQFAQHFDSRQLRHGKIQHQYSWSERTR